MNKLFTSAFLLMAVWANATIHYTNVYEYAYPNDRYYDLDLDGDNDFKFSYNGNDYIVECLKTTSYYAADGTTGSTPKAYAAGSAMGTHHWYYGTGSLINNGFFSSTSKYMMVKFNNTQGSTFYGWFYLSGSNGGGTFLIISYAYDDVPNQTITAGNDGQTGINQINGTDFSLLVTSTGIKINATGNYTATVTNLIGQQVLQAANTNTIYTNGLARGVYIVTLQDEKNKQVSRKITVQ